MPNMDFKSFKIIIIIYIIIECLNQFQTFIQNTFLAKNLIATWKSFINFVFEICFIITFNEKNLMLNVFTY